MSDDAPHPGRRSDRSTQRQTAPSLDRIWASMGGDRSLIEQVEVTGPAVVLPSLFDVTGLAAASAAAATLAAAEHLAVRNGVEVPRVLVDRRAAAASFVSEQRFTPVGWEQPPTWDAVAGDYETADGWIRLHTNYRHHRRAVERVLGPVVDRAEVAIATRRRSAVDLETDVVEAGGCAAAMHDLEWWRASDAGRVACSEPLVRIGRVAGAAGPAAPALPSTRPFTGVRVLDLTRVIAGPVCTRILAAWGADVLRIDPPGFDEVAALLPETTVGKRCAELDLRTIDGRARFGQLVADADVLVTGLRPGAIAHLGLDLDGLRAINPSLIVAELDAYGWDGSWRHRRGFDSLVQMSVGIAAAGAAALGRLAPTPLPAQALDHGTGHLLAAAVGRALTDRAVDGSVQHVRCSLVGTANELLTTADPSGLDVPAPTWSEADTVPTSTHWGSARRAPIAGSIQGVAPTWSIDAGPLGRHTPTW